jgi:hypothetical protein
MQRTLLAGRAAAGSDRQLERQHADEHVDDPTGKEAGPGQPFERCRTGDSFAMLLAGVDRPAWTAH